MHTIRLANENDKEQILALLNSVFKVQQRSAVLRDERYWDWKFISSPFGRSVLTVAEENGEIIGVDNLWPWEFNINGDLHKAYQPCDSAVQAQFRGKGILREMRLHGLDTVKASNPSFIFNFPNQQSIRTNLSLGWFNLGRIPWMVKPVSPFRIIKAILDSILTISMPLDEGYRIDIEQLENLDLATSYCNSRIKPHRINGYFEWRYTNHPSRHYGMIYTCKENKALAAIFTINQCASYREMFIVELIGDPTIMNNLIREAIKTAKGLDVSIISLMQNSSFGTNELWRMGFMQKKIKNMVVLPFNSLIEPDLKSYDGWSLFPCLHDSI